MTVIKECRFLNILPLKSVLVKQDGREEGSHNVKMYFRTSAPSEESDYHEYTGEL